MLPANSRGLTTQKIVWSVSSGSACRVVATRTLTWVWSGVSSVLCTVPRTDVLEFQLRLAGLQTLGRCRTRS